MDAFMLKRIGVYVDQCDIAVAVVERGKMVWSAAAPLSVDHHMSDHGRVASTLGLLLDRIPKSRWPGLVVNTAIGAPWARVKLLKGVPPVNRHSELVSLLRLNTSRFVASSRPIIITGALATSSGDVHVGVADRSVVDAITNEITSRKLRMGRIVPATSIDLGGNSPGSAGRASTVRELSTGETIAVRVATARGLMPLGLSAQDNPAAAVPDISPKRITVAGAVLVAVALLYVGSQLNIERVTLARDAAAVRRMAAVSDSGVREEAELRRLNRDLANAANFSRHRVSTALLLGAITQALPAEAAITTLRIDSANVDIVALSPRTAAVVDALSDVPNVASPTIIGPVSRETVGPRELERATIRLRIAPDYDRGKASFAVDRGTDR